MALKRAFGVLSGCDAGTVSPASQPGGGKWELKYRRRPIKPAVAEFITGLTFDLAPQKFFQHFGIDVTAADDGDVEFGFRKFIFVE